MGVYNSRPEQLGEYIVSHFATIRGTSNVFHMSKSTVHLDVSKRLKKINFSLYLEVKKILEINLKERNIRGGEATKNKYLKLKKSS